MKRRWWLLATLAPLAVGCADSVPVECPQGFGLSEDGVECQPHMPNEPDAGTEPDGGSVEPFSTCVEAECDDGNACTLDGCDRGECASVPAENGTACVFEDGAGVCEAGTCIPDCEIEDCRVVYPCTEQGLRDAVADGGDIVIGCNGSTTVGLSGGSLQVNRDLRIDGLGKLTIDAQQNHRIFTVEGPAVFEVVGIAMTGGNASNEDPQNGGAIYSHSGAETTVRDCQIFGNTAEGTGGGVHCGGKLTIIGSEITHNQAGNHAGGVRGSSNTLIQDSIISYNTSGNRGGGAAFWKQTLIENSTIVGNHAAADGGAIYLTYGASTGPLPTTIRNSEIVGNSTDGSGGGIWSSAIVTISGGVMRDNAGNGGGGAIRNFRGSVTIEDGALLANNSAGTDGGAVANYDTPSLFSISEATFTGNSAATGSGGAIQTDRGPIEVTSSVFDGNLAGNIGGAMYAKQSDIVLQTTTFSSNRARYGGAFRVLGNNPVRLENCTISGNQATETAGGFAAKHAPVAMVHTTMTKNTAGLVGSGPHLTAGAELHAQHSVIDNGCYADADSLFISLGYNAILTPDSEQCVLTPVDGASTDLALGGDQMGLEALGDNGSGPPTHMPVAGSALIDAIPAESCIAELDHDQRGEPRNGGACDIGAVEVQPGE